MTESQGRKWQMGGLVGTLSTAGTKHYSGGQDAFTGDFFVLVEVIDEQDNRSRS